MSKDVKAIILCNNPIAIPTIREFLFYGKTGAIVVTKRNREMQGILTALLQETNIPVIVVTPQDYKEKLMEAIEEHSIDTGIMITFPFKIPVEILSKPARGFINFHFGLLPQCRGPQPILWHLLNNDKEAGVTIHKVDSGIDTGEVIMQEKMAIADTDTYGSLTAKLAYVATKPAVNLLKILSYGSLVPSKPQDESKANYYEMPTSKDLMVDWAEMNAQQIVRLVNACNPWNKGAGAKIEDWLVGITEAEPTVITENSGDADAGTIIACNKTDGLVVKTNGEAYLKINIVYLQEGFYSGYRLADFGVKPGMKFN